MTPRERILASLNHEEPDRLPVDFGSSFITGIHCSVVEALRDHYALPRQPVKICEPYQMLGQIDQDLLEALGIDVEPIFPHRTIFGFTNEDWKAWYTPWGQEVLVSRDFQTSRDANGNTFKHSCGAVEPLIETFIDSGFDILNPVQCSAEGMDPQHLKVTYGKRITFWGGGVNTQQTLPFGSPQEVRKEVLERCRILAPGGGFVFNAIHNVQAGTPTENVVAMFEAVHAFNQERYGSTN